MRALSLLVCLLLAGSTIALADPPINMNVSVEPAPRHKLALSVKIRNDEVAPLTVYPFELPWFNQDTLHMSAVRVDRPGIQIEYGFLIQDAPRSRVNIRPGETIEGIVDLGGRFKEFERHSKETDLVVYWSFQLRTVDGRNSKRTGGWLVLQAER